MTIDEMAIAANEAESAWLTLLSAPSSAYLIDAVRHARRQYEEAHAIWEEACAHRGPTGHLDI